jgi:hypothetical protein
LVSNEALSDVWAGAGVVDRLHVTLEQALVCSGGNELVRWRGGRYG